MAKQSVRQTSHKNSGKYARYRAQNRKERNKARKMLRHLNKFGKNDLAAHDGFIDMASKNMVVGIAFKKHIEKIKERADWLTMQKKEKMEREAERKQRKKDLKEIASILSGQFKENE